MSPNHLSYLTTCYLISEGLPEKLVSVLLDGEESTMEFIDLEGRQVKLYMSIQPAANGTVSIVNADKSVSAQIRT